MRGSCLCGAVTYDATPPTSGLRIGLCSCHTCRKTHAAPFIATAPVARDGFRWLGGLDKIRAFESSPGKRRHFCKVCGTHLIDEDPGTRPVDHIWRLHEVPWCAWGGDIKLYDEWPPASELERDYDPIDNSPNRRR